MALSQRIARIEDRLVKNRSNTNADFWSERLALLTDAQLDRLEALYSVISAKQEAESLPWIEAVHVISEPDQIELQAIFAVMGVYPEDMAL
ncbi:hypothetical protein [Devosia alba]|uniref:hypothetical protein n=1 Tax=Devosia alba TaxID=3152360 RepID=UPI003267A253